MRGTHELLFHCLIRNNKNTKNFQPLSPHRKGGCAPLQNDFPNDGFNLCGSKSFFSLLWPLTSPLSYDWAYWLSLNVELWFTSVGVNDDQVTIGWVKMRIKLHSEDLKHTCWKSNRLDWARLTLCSAVMSYYLMPSWDMSVCFMSAFKIKLTAP